MVVKIGGGPNYRIIRVVAALAVIPLIFVFLREVLNIPDGKFNGDFQLAKWVPTGSALSFETTQRARAVVEYWEDERRFDLSFVLKKKHDSPIIGELVSDDFSLGNSFPVEWSALWKESAEGDGVLECNYISRQGLLVCNGSLCGATPQGRYCRHVSFTN